MDSCGMCIINIILNVWKVCIGVVLFCKEDVYLYFLK